MAVGILSTARASDSASRTKHWPPAVLGMLPVVCAVLLWILSLRVIDIRSMNDLGLVSILPPGIFLALFILTASFCVALRLPEYTRPVLALHVVTLVLMLYGITALIEDVPRFSVTWLHMGFTEYIARTGQINPSLDARFSWPGFFILSAFLTQVAGLPPTDTLLSWAPVFFNLLYLGPLYLIFSAATNDRRLPWLGTWFFYLTNWIGQDYFAPQALNYYLYLVILGILLKWFKGSATRQPGSLSRLLLSSRRLGPIAARVYGWLAPADVLDRPARPQYAGLMLIVIALSAVTVFSHQLTPFFLLAAVAALVAARQCSARGLPILLAVMIGTWVSYMTIAFLVGHISMVTDSVGQVSNTVKQNITGRLRGSPEHVLVLQIRILMTASIMGLAVLGGIRRVRRGYRDVAYIVLAAIPFSLLILQAYGGEMLLRVYLFALPFMLFFVATLFYTAPGAGRSWRTTVLLALASLGLLAGFLFSRYGNERMDYMTANEVSAVNYLYSIAEPNALLLAGMPNLPWKFQDVEKYDYASAADEVLVGNVQSIAERMAQKRHYSSYLILTRSQQAYAELYYGLVPGAWEQFENDLIASQQFEPIYSNPDAQIFVLVNARSGARP